jgi:hypothetical protein
LQQEKRVRQFIKALAIALPVAIGIFVPLSVIGGGAYAQVEDTGEKERRLREVISEALPASRVPEIYADVRRVLREAYLPSMRDAAKDGTPGTPQFDAEIMQNLGKIISLLHYTLRAGDEAEPFLNQHRDEIIADFARLQAKYLTLPEIQALRDLLNLPAMRKVFNTVYATSRLFTDYSYQELRSYYEMTAWFRELKITAENNPFTQPDARAPSPELVGKAQGIINDFLRVSRMDEIVAKVTRFMKELQQTDLIPQEQREEIKAGLEKFEFFYNLQKSMMMAVGPSALAAVMNREQLEKLHLLVLAPVTSKSFRLIDEIVREATSFSKDDIASFQKFADDTKSRGLFKERSAEDKARIEAETKALAEAWGERIKGSLTPETREGLERSIQAMEEITGKEKAIEDDGSDDDTTAPGQQQL